MDYGINMPTLEVAWVASLFQVKKGCRAYLLSCVFSPLYQIVEELIVAVLVVGVRAMIGDNTVNRACKLFIVCEA